MKRSIPSFFVSWFLVSSLSSVFFSRYSSALCLLRSSAEIAPAFAAVFAEETTKLADTNTVFFRDEYSWRWNSPNGQNIEKGENVVAHFSSTADPSLTLEVPMTLHHESWLSATVDYTKYDTVYFSGRESGGSAVKTESLSMDVLKIFYRVGSSGKNPSGNFKLYSYTDTTQDDD